MIGFIYFIYFNYLLYFFLLLVLNIKEDTIFAMLNYASIFSDKTLFNQIAINWLSIEKPD